MASHWGDGSSICDEMGLMLLLSAVIARFSRCGEDMIGPGKCLVRQVVDRGDIHCRSIPDEEVDGERPIESKSVERQLHSTISR